MSLWHLSDCCKAYLPTYHFDKACHDGPEHTYLPVPDALQALRNLIVDCVDERMMAPAAASGSQAQGAAPLASVVAAVQSSLSARFQDAWPLALPVRHLSSRVKVCREGDFGQGRGAAPLASVVAVLSSLSARFQDAWPWHCR